VDAGWIVGQIEAGADADFQHVARHVGELLAAVSGHERPIQEEVAQARKDDLGVPP
jgi:hypothetical protein